VIKSKKTIPISNSYNFHELAEYGDSMFFEVFTHKLRSAATMYGIYHKFKIVTRKEGEGIRVWRGKDINEG